MADRASVVAVCGATALGKSDVALALAERLQADIVVADSMQVYAGLTLLTNQPDERRRASVRYHLVGFVPPQQDFTVAEYAAQAHDCIDRVLSEGRRVIVEGGSGLYLRAALGDLAFGAPPDAELRRSLEDRWTSDRDGLVAELARLAPQTSVRIDTRNGRRVIRALEAEYLRRETGEQHPHDALWQSPERYPHRLFALLPDEDRSVLKARIEARVDGMIADGVLDEVEAARAAGALSRTARQAIGVRELCAALDGQSTMEEATTRMKARTRALARRQLTWIRKLPDAVPVPVAERSPSSVAESLASFLEERS